jgi:virulence-associated protein VagC
LVLAEIQTTFVSMETATVTVEGDRQTVRLPRSVHLPSTVFVRQDGESVVLEPAKPKTWPEGFFDSIHVTDPAFERPEQGQLPPAEPTRADGLRGVNDHHL